MKTRLTLIVFLLNSIVLISQSKIWYFGQNAGIDFNSNSPTVLTNGLLNTGEGCSVATDDLGRLLFYTDGQNVYQPTFSSPNGLPHITMQNGSGLFGNSTSTQSAVIVPCPGFNCTKFYIFTVDSYAVLGNNSKGLNYSEVVITGSSYNNYVASVTVKNKPLLNHNNTNLPSNQQVTITEKLASASDGNGGYWVVAHGLETSVNVSASNNPNSIGRKFYSFHVGSNNVSCLDTNAVISTTGEILHQLDNGASLNMIGELKFSASGTKLATAVFSRNFVEIFNFNVSNGVVSPSLATIDVAANQTNASWSYGVEFSPNENYLYFSQARTIAANQASSIRRLTLSLISNAQNPISNGNVLWNNSIVIASVTYTGTEYDFCALKTAPPPNTNQQIYIARYGQNQIGVINQSNSINPTFSGNAINLGLGRLSFLGLPTTAVGIGGFCNPIPLPIQITHFEGHTTNNINTLFWHTEISNSGNYFELQRSTDNVNFYTIATIYEISNNKSYSYEDKNLIPNSYYYRIKVIDTDGLFDYSNIIELNVSYVELVSNYFYPNPAKNKITSNELFDKIYISAADGRLIYEGENQKEVTIERLTEGLYFIRFSKDGAFYAQKIMKIK